MKKMIVTAATFVASVAQANVCTVELQYQGNVLGQNTFSAPDCRSAMRECKRTEKIYEIEHNLGELACARVDSMPAPGNGGYNPYPPTNPEPPVPRPNPPYSRLEAMRELDAMENSSSDADGNYNLIMNHVEAGQIGLKEGVEIFRILMRANGGSGSTSESRAAFSKIVASLRSSSDPMADAYAYEEMAGLENGPSDAVKNLSIAVDVSSSEGLSLKSALNSFVRLLKTWGSGKTDDVGQVFERLANGRSLRPFDRAVEDYITLAVLENTPEDAMKNYELVVEASLRAGIPYREALKSMQSLSKSYGANSTATVQTKFKEIYRF